MERTSNFCALAFLATLIILVLFPARSWCKEDTYTLETEAKPECCAGGEAALKRFDDIDYDAFVSLMGRRSAAPPHRHMDHILSDLLGRRTRKACPCAEKYSITMSGPLTDAKQRFQRFL